MTRIRKEQALPKGKSAIWAALAMLLFAVGTRAQTWTWTSETVDTSGLSNSLALDAQGNLHLSYITETEGGFDGEVKYGFRPAGSTRWFTMVLTTTGGYHAFTKLALDPSGNPHICFTPGKINYANWDGRRWHIQEIAPGTGNENGYSCTVAVGPDGVAHVSWYHYALPNGPLFLHFKYAFLKDGLWSVRTMDFAVQTGKWHSMALDAHGSPRFVYDSFANGQLKYMYWDGKKWTSKVVDSREISQQNNKNVYSRGMGNALVLNDQGKAQISYEDDDSLKYARETGTSWSLETVDHIGFSGNWEGYRTRQVLDSKGFPHISYDDSGTVKHASWDGKQWFIEVISPRGAATERYNDIVIDSHDTLYITYRDAFDGSLKLATGRLATKQTAAIKKKGEN